MNAHLITHQPLQIYLKNFLTSLLEYKLQIFNVLFYVYVISQSSKNKKPSPSTLGFSGHQPLGVHTSHAIDWPQWGISSGELSRPEEKGVGPTTQVALGQ